MQALRRFFSIFILSALLVLLIPCVSVAAEELLTSSAPAVVMFNNQPLFAIHPVAGRYTAEERTRIIEIRLQRIANSLINENVSYNVEDLLGETILMVNKQLFMVISEADAVAEKKSRQSLGEERGLIVQTALQQYYEDTRPKNLAIRVAVSLLATGFFYLLWRLSGWLAQRFANRLQRGVGNALKIQEYVLLSEQNTQTFLKNLVRLLLWPFRFLLFYSYAYVILETFPKTRIYSDQILLFIWQPASELSQLLLDFLPNFITILVILLFCRYILLLLRLFSREIENGSIVLPGFHREWAATTYSIIRALAVLLTIVAIFPYIPGSHSPVFQGISVFLGLLVSVASSSTISNIVAGYVLLYNRAFNIGDVIRSGDCTGVITHRSLLATQMRTFKNEIVTLPNSLLLGGSILNYSAHINDTGVTLHTAITIGYNAPWRTVHELMKQAAARTDGILTEPAPFVLQTALNDFYVAYELNAFTRNPEQMPRLYSDLHHNIQDCFNEGGVEIMSPHYTSFRNGNQTTIPKQYSQEG